MFCPRKSLPCHIMPLHSRPLRDTSVHEVGKALPFSQWSEVLTVVLYNGPGHIAVSEIRKSGWAIRNLLIGYWQAGLGISVPRPCGQSVIVGYYYGFSGLRRPLSLIEHHIAIK